MHRARRMRNILTLASHLAVGGFLFQGCSLFRQLDECFGENTISRAEYEDLNAIQQLAYERNDCGRYAERRSFFDRLFD